MWRFKWHIAIIYIALIAVVLIAIFTGLLDASQAGKVPNLVWFLVACLLLITTIIMLSNILKILDSLNETNTKFERMIASLEKVRAQLSEVNHSARLSDMAKSIAFRDTDRQSLREAVFEKLQQRNFKAAYEIIDDIERRGGFAGLAEELRAQAEQHRGATETERMSQSLAHIEELFGDYQWLEAHAEIERLIQAYPNAERPKQMRQRMLEKREERKRILLNAWDDAVRRHATDRSLEILKELDTYLTPAEAVDLQDAARDVFKDKLHNLGVQFSLAISGEQWDKALEVGEQITRNFPNSRIAVEIREKMDVLRQKMGIQRS